MRLQAPQSLFRKQHLSAIPLFLRAVTADITCTDSAAFHITHLQSLLQFKLQFVAPFPNVIVGAAFRRTGRRTAAPTIGIEDVTERVTAVDKIKVIPW